jgi:acyl carrier protein
MTVEDLRGIVAGILGIEPSRLVADAGPQSIETWDSLAHLTIMTAVEERFGVRFRMDEIRRIDNFGMLERILQERLQA